jgi:hypothetical protein
MYVRRKNENPKSRAHVMPSESQPVSKSHPEKKQKNFTFLLDNPFTP